MPNKWNEVRNRRWLPGFRKNTICTLLCGKQSSYTHCTEEQQGVARVDFEKAIPIAAIRNEVESAHSVAGYVGGDVHIAHFCSKFGDFSR